MTAEERLLRLVERLLWCLDDGAPEEEIDAAVSEAIAALEKAERPIDEDSQRRFENRVSAADWRHLCERSIQIMLEKRWSLVPHDKKAWRVQHDGEVIDGHRNPVKAILRSAGYDF
jgi:hypothetical protein